MWFDLGTPRIILLRSPALGSEIAKVYSNDAYEVGEGNRIWFWYDPWSGHLPLRELYPDLFTCSISKEAMVCVGFLQESRS